jgi:DNA-binding protein H-NS
MKADSQSKKSIDELWILHEQIVDILSSKILEETARLERKLIDLNLQTAVSSNERVPRPYPPVRPKFRNPVRPSETWAGRGRQPRWLSAQLKSGKRLEDFRILA